MTLKDNKTSLISPFRGDEPVKITELRKITDERFELSLDSGEKLRVTLNDVADFSLYTGRELTEAELSELRAAAALSRTKDRALKLIGTRAFGERELYDRLVEKGEPERLAAETVAWLVGLHLLDDAEYAAMLVRHYAAKGYGPRRIRDELYRRKLPRETWDEALSALPQQDDTIDKLLRARLRSTEPDRAELKRATDALLRRGFGWDEIREAVERFRSD